MISDTRGNCVRRRKVTTLEMRSKCSHIGESHRSQLCTSLKKDKGETGCNKSFMKYLPSKAHIILGRAARAVGWEQQLKFAHWQQQDTRWNLLLCPFHHLHNICSDFSSFQHFSEVGRNKTRKLPSNNIWLNDREWKSSNWVSFILINFPQLSASCMC